MKAWADQMDPAKQTGVSLERRPDAAEILSR